MNDTGNKGPYVCVIGGSAIDISGYPRGKLKLYDSNPGTVRLSHGGVGRNIAENCARLGLAVTLLSAVGDDIHGENIISRCRDLNINTDMLTVVRGKSTCIYLTIQDETGDMVCSVSDMDVTDEIDTEFLRGNRALIEGAAAVVVDANLAAKVLEYLLTELSGVTFFADPVSTVKAEKLKHLVPSLPVLRCNCKEAEILSGLTIDTDEDFLNAVAYFLEEGVHEVFISRGPDGICYGSGKERGFFRPRPVTMVNSNGAGDSFMAGLVYGTVSGMPLSDKVGFASAAASLTVQCGETVHPSLSAQLVRERSAHLC